MRPNLTYSFLPATLAFTAGITWAKYAQVPESFSWLLIILLATRLIVALRRQSSPFTPYLILPLFFLLGGVHTTPYSTPPTDPHHIYNLLPNRQEAVISGILLNAPEIGPTRTHLLLQAKQLQFTDQAIAVSGLVQLTLPEPPASHLGPGDYIMARTLLSRPQGFRVPGTFDYQSFLAYKSIWVTGWLKSSSLLTRVYRLPPDSFTKKIPFLAEQARQKIGRFISKTLPPESSGIYKALLIGDRSSIPPDLVKQYKLTGSIHLLAISGMHMGILALCLSIIINWLVSRSERLLLKWPLQKTTSVICLLPLGIYAFIAGFHPPVIRALLMAYILMGAILCNRQWSISNNIAIAALIMLSLKPTELYTVSFQLSFAAVSAIALIYPHLAALCQFDSLFSGNKSATRTTSRPKKLAKIVLASVMLSLAATIGTAPLLAYHFNRISILSPVTTLLIEPFLCLWALILGLFGCLLLPFPQIAAIIFKTGALGITISNGITATLAQIPGASLWLPTPPIPVISTYYGLLLLFFWLITKGTSWKKSFLISAICLFALTTILLLQKNQPPSNVTTISILDVGQGQAVVLEFPDNKTFLLDGGRTQGSNKSTFNIGESLIAPFLWQRGINKLDGIIISHPHADHYDGLPFIVEHFKPKAIWISDTRGEPAFNKLIDRAKQLQIPIIIPTSKNFIYRDNDRKIYLENIQHPAPALAIKPRGNTNNDGLVIKLTNGNKSILFPGDIEQETEKILVALDAPIKADIFIAPHHGSITSSTSEFIKKIAAKEVVISAAISKWGKFPNMTVIKRYQKAGLKIIATGNSGTIFIKIANNKITTKTSVTAKE